MEINENTEDMIKSVIDVYCLQENHGITHIYEHDSIKLPVKERPRWKLWNLFMK